MAERRMEIIIHEGSAMKEKLNKAAAHETEIPF